MKAKPVTEEELHALADNQLAAPRKAELEAWLAVHPREAVQVAGWRRQNALLHRAYDHILSAPLPSRLLDAVRGPSRFSVLRLAAVLAWMAVGGVIGFLARGEGPGATTDAAVPQLARQAAIAHAVFVPEVRHPVEVGAEQEAHLVAWLSKRLGAPLKAPHLEAAGYGLLGGRLLAGEGGGGNGAVAQFMYQDGHGARLTLYVRNAAKEQADSGEAGFRYAREGAVSVFYWIEGRFGYALAGDIDKAQLLDVATLVYQQINP
jgi:anti-sigma factor RsiW